MKESDKSPAQTADRVAGPPNTSAKETVISARDGPVEAPFRSVEFRPFAHARCGATNFSTGLATFSAGAAIPYHQHEYSEAITILQGQALIWTEGRCHQLGSLDCIHVPRGVAHRVANAREQALLVLHCAHASPTPSHQPVQDDFGSTLHPNGERSSTPGKETIVRKVDVEMYELAPGSRFCDLFAGRLGSVGICGGYGEFDPGSALPCHFHEFDESISIIIGEALCEVAGSRYRCCDTAFVPKWRPHRFLNTSSDLMAMIWVYAGSEPERTLVDPDYCTGRLKHS
jgi:quercetin dioxygenase-like cupin family protein